MTKEKLADFEKMTRPLIQWLNENYHPHVTIIITPTNAELLEGQMNFPTNDYIKDYSMSHASDCALHNGPAYTPLPCDCGAEPEMTPEKYGSEYPADTLEAACSRIQGNLKATNRPPIKGEEGYAFYMWLCEQDFD